MSATLSRKNKGKVIVAWDNNPKLGTPPKRRLKYMKVKSPNIDNTDEYSHNSRPGNSIDTGENSKKHGLMKIYKFPCNHNIQKNSQSCQSFDFKNKKVSEYPFNHKKSDRSKNFDESMENSYETSPRKYKSPGSSHQYDKESQFNLEYQKKILEEIREIRNKKDTQKKNQILTKIKDLDKQLKSHAYHR